VIAFTGAYSRLSRPASMSRRAGAQTSESSLLTLGY
jgi:hypothetical protein